MPSRISLPYNFPGVTLGLVILGSGLVLVGAPRADKARDWRALAPGLELRYVPVKRANFSTDSRITILRIDAHLWELELIGKSQIGESASRTARAWCEAHKLTAAINAGMFMTDGSTHLGLMRAHQHANNGKANNYQSVAAFDPRDATSSTPFRIFDLDAPQTSMQSILKDYDSVVQNLRLIKRPGTNQWSQQNRMWSEAALGEDDSGRALFIFSRAPFSMHDLNQELLGAGIGIVAAQHLEGGPEAQLYLNAGGEKLEMFGSFETSFVENDSNSIPWPIPNILGIRPRPQERDQARNAADGQKSVLSTR